MPLATRKNADFLRALPKLGRVSNLPTVWSNGLAGWLLGGGGDENLFYVVLTSATCLYLGGVFTHDAWDAEADRQQKPGRPIPAGLISVWKVWCVGCLFWVGGLVLAALVGSTALLLALGLLACASLYNAGHARFAGAPVLLGACRSLVVLLAASASYHGIDGLTLWSALALGIYVAGLSFLARDEDQPQRIKYWPAALLFAPIALCLLVNDGPFGRRGLVVALVLFFWLLGCLTTAYREEPGRLRQGVAKLLAGIVLVDMAAVGPAHPEMVVFFPLLFVAALALQRFVPAT